MKCEYNHSTIKYFAFCLNLYKIGRVINVVLIFIFYDSPKLSIQLMYRLNAYVALY